MNSAVKQNPKSLSRLLSPWATLAALLLAALPSSGQVTLSNGPITIVDATLDNTVPPPQPSIPSKANPYGTDAAKVNLGDTYSGKTVAGRIQKVAVTLNGFTHPYVSDVDMLLQGPDGKTVLLMSDVAIGQSVASSEITIDDTASAAFPESGAPGAILAGSFRTTDFQPGDVFPSGAPSFNPADKLSVFNGGNGKGDWKLFVADDRRVDSGEIRSWTLKLWYTPVITAVTSTNTDEDTPIDIPVNIADLDNDVLASGYSVTAVTSGDDTNRVDAAGLSVIKPASGNTFTLRVTPRANANGSANIQVRVNDGTSVETVNVALTINAKNDVPTLGVLKIGSTETNIVRLVQGQLSPAYTVAVADIDSALAGIGLSAQNSGTDTNVVLATDVFFVPGETGATRTFYVAPKGAATGDTAVNLIATDSAPTNSAPKAVAINVAQATDRLVFANFHPVTVAATENSTNSSTIAVSGITDAKIGRIAVTLANVSHDRPEDLDVWVVGPDGTKVTLMNQAGGANAVRNGRITFDGTAASSAPDSDALIASGAFQATYRPVDYSGITTPNLGDFAGKTPVGNWTVFVVDRVAGTGGTIAGGVILQIKTAPVIGAIADRSVAEDSASQDITFTVADLDGKVNSVTAFSNDASKASADVTSFTAGGTSGVIRVNPQPNAFGASEITVIATDNDGFTVTRKFAFTINSVNDLPTISPISKQLTYAGRPVPDITPVVINDVETPAASLVVRATSSNRTLLPDANISIIGTGATRTLRLFPLGTSGNDSADITITVTDADGGTVQTTFRLDVLPKASPLFVKSEQIVFRDSGLGGAEAAAVPSPSELTVSGLVGKVSRVRVNLVGLEHPRPQDLDILLVGPQGQKVMLLSDAGGSTPVANVHLSFDDGALDLVSVGGPLQSGPYRPTDLAGADSDIFRVQTGTAPTAPVPNNPLSIFNDTDPNGVWRLYVMDDTGNAAGDDKVGVIAQGWQLSLETVPVLGTIANQTTREDEPVRVTVNLGDDQPGLPFEYAFTLNNNPTLIDTSKVTFSEGGANRIMTIVPEQNKSGEATLELEVRIGGRVSNRQSFKVTVTAVNDNPTIAGLGTTYSVPVGLILGPIAFTVADAAESTDPALLTVTATSGNPAVLPNANLIVRGTGANRTITVLPPSSREAISASVNVTVTDPQNGSTTHTFTYGSSARTSLVFSEPSRIFLDDNSQARPYPSVIPVSGVAGLVNQVRVTLNGFSHIFPDDVHLLLVKGDKAVVLMGNAGGGAPTNSVSGLVLGFDDAASSPVPDNDILAHGIYRPARYGDVQTAPNASANGIPATYSANLSAFNGIDPNGDWKLFAWDDTRTDAGEITGGWTLAINTGPRIVSVTAAGRDGSPLLGTEDVSLPISILLADADVEAANKLTLTATVLRAPGSDDVLLTSGLTLDTNTTNQFTRIINALNRTNISGAITNTIRFVASDGLSSDTKEVQISFAPVDDAPILTTATNIVVIAEDTWTNVVINISDVDSVLSVTNVTASSENTRLLPGVGISGPVGLTAGTAGSLTITNVPAANQFGDSVVTVNVRDNASRVTPISYTLRVNPVNDSPTISALANLTSASGDNAGIEAGASRNVVFQVDDLEVDPKTIRVTAKARIKGTALAANSIPDANLTFSESGTNRVLNIRTIGTAAELVTITVTADDGQGADNSKTDSSFDVQVFAPQPVPGTVYANTTAANVANLATVALGEIRVDTAGSESERAFARLHRLSVTVAGITHTAPDDLDILLVAPDGRGVVLMSDAGGRVAVTNLTLEFSDTGANGALRDDGPLVPGVFVPSNYTGDNDTWTGFSGTIVRNLADLNNINPNGIWRILVADDAAADTGAIAQGWSIKVVTTPVIRIDTAGGGTDLVNHDEDRDGFSRLVISDLDVPGATIEGYEITKTSTDENIIKSAKVAIDARLSTLGTPQSSSYTATPEPNRYDRSTNLTITATVRRKSDGATRSVAVKHVITAVNDLPEITRTTDRSTNEDTDSEPLMVTVSDQLEPGSESGTILLDLVATSSNQSAVSDTNIFVTGATGVVSNRVAVEAGRPFAVVVRPNANAAAGGSVQTLITLTATDRNTNAPARQSNASIPGFGQFTLTINPRNDAPSITQPANQTVETGGSKTIAITVSDPDDASNIKVTGVSSDERVIKSQNIVVSPEVGGTGERTVTFRAEANLDPTTVNITLNVVDKNGGAGASTGTPRTFTVNVTPSREQRFTGGSVDISEFGAASQYPSVIQVDSLNGVVTKVRVELRNFTHGYPDDVDLVLVSPTGKKVVLMSDAGGSTGVTNLNFVFDQAGTSIIGDTGPLLSGTYRPANHDLPNDPFPATASGSAFTAPASPFEVTLDAFNGTTAKGAWQLYAVDDTRQDGGRIGEWNLYIATGPRITDLANVGALPEDTTFEVPFKVLDEVFVTGVPTFGFASTNPSVVAVSGLSVTPRRGEDFVLSGRPVANATGATEITIYATNSFGQVASGKFTVSFTPVNDLPVISPTTGSLLLSSGESGQFGFNYSDAETTQKDLQLTIVSSDPELIPTGNIFLFDTNLVIAPVGNRSGSANITVTVTDSTGGTATGTYSVRVEPALHAQFANTTPIVLPVSGPGNPSPSVIPVSGVRGRVSKVTVTLAQVYHNYPADIDVLLVSPELNGVSKKVVLMSDAGGGRALTPSRLTFDDGAASKVPYNPATAVAPGSYKPTNEEGTSDTWTGAPAGPYTYVLSDFVGIDPNGDWKLYVMDDVAPDSGRIDGGWVLNIFTTEPSIAPIADVSTPETVPVTVAFRVADSDTTITPSNIRVVADRPSLLAVGNVTPRTPTVADPFNNFQVTLTPVGFNNGDSAVTVEVNDGSATAGTSFRVVVTPVNQAPSLGAITDKTTPANRTLTVPLVIADNETAASNLVVSATLDRPTFGAVEVTSGGANRSLVFRPAGEKGVTAVTVVVSDSELSTTNQFLVTVADPYVLTVSTIADQSIPENGSRNVPFSVLGSETGNVSVEALAETGGVLRSVRVEGSGTAWIAILDAVPGANGSTVVTVTARDEFGAGTRSFTANIVPIDDPPTIAPIADVTTFANINAIVRTVVADPDTALNALEFTWASSNPTLVRSVLFALTGDTLIATVIPNRDEIGQASLTIFANDGTTKVGRPFLLTVSERPNLPPTLAPISDQETFANIPAFVRLNINDPDTLVSDLTITASASNTDLVQSVVPALGVDGSAILNIRPRRDATGISAIQVSVNDGRTTVTRSFILTVKATPNEAPVLGAIADQTLEINTPASVDLVVSDVDTAIADLVITGEASNPAVLRPVQVSNSGTGVKIRLVPVTDASGTTAVTVTVDDGANKVSRTFAVTVKAAAAPELAKPSITTLPDGSRVIQVTWQGGGELEWATSANGPWTKTGNSSGNYTEPVGEGAKLFRVVRRI